MSQKLRLSLVDAIKASISSSHKNKLIKEQAEKCLECRTSFRRDIRVNHNGGTVKEPTEITGFTYSERANYVLPNRPGYSNFETSTFYSYRTPVNMQKVGLNWYDIEKSYREGTELGCAIKNSYLARAIEEARAACLSNISKEMTPIVNNASFDALKNAGIKSAAAGSSVAIGASFLRGCDAEASENSNILFPECEWDESVNIVEKKRSIIVDEEVYRFDEPIASGPCSINVVFINQPGEYRLSKKTFKMKGWDPVSRRGLPAPESGPPDPWRYHTPLSSWIDYTNIPPGDQTTTYWGGTQLGISNLRKVSPGLSPGVNLSPEQFSQAVGPALELLDALSVGLYFIGGRFGGPLFLAIDCAIEQAFGGNSYNPPGTSSGS